MAFQVDLALVLVTIWLLLLGSVFLLDNFGSLDSLLYHSFLLVLILKVDLVDVALRILP